VSASRQQRTIGKRVGADAIEYLALGIGKKPWKKKRNLRPEGSIKNAPKTSRTLCIVRKKKIRGRKKGKRRIEGSGELTIGLERQD